MFYLNLDKETEKRFDISKFVPFYDMHDIVDSYFIEKIRELPSVGTYTAIEEGKPDIVSYKIYKDTQYWWILLEYNNLISFEDIKVGTRLNYFSLSSLEELYFSLQGKSLG